MSFTVTNQRNQSQFTVAAKETVLDAALRESRMYPYGCRSGACGSCKCQLVAGEVDYGKYEEFALTEEEKAAGKVLLCQAVPRSDLIIDVEEIKTGANIQIKMLPCRVTKITRLAADVIQIFLILPKTQTFNFLPGQYITLLLKDGRRRSFSIANRPEQLLEQGLELHIRHVADGHFTPRVFASMRERDLLRFEGPFGTYILQSEPQTSILMIAGGTGFSPIKGLLEQAMGQYPSQSIHLFWGARDQQDLYMREQVAQWQATYPNLKYTPVLSDATGDEWTGKTGFVHQAVCEHYPNVTAYDIYASGPPPMIDAVKQSLLERGMNPARFFFDSFDFEPPE